MALFSCELSDLVKDWGGFERLVAQLHETGDVSVEHNVVLQGRSGAPRQIDVLVRHRQGLYEHKVVIECKYRNQSIERLHVDALATTVREVGADRGVIFSSHGFQSGAVMEAKHQGIDLLKVREPTDEEWGLPGRHVDVWIHVIGFSVGNPKPIDAFSMGPALLTSPEIEIVLGDDSAEGTPVLIGEKRNTLEGLIAEAAQYSARQAYQPIRLQFEDGTFNGEFRTLVNVNLAPHVPIQLLRGTGQIFIKGLEFQVGIAVNQSRLQIDRGANYAFLLAVEDCVRNKVTSASRRKDVETTVLAELEPDVGRDPNDILVNGSIIQVWMKGYQSFDDFAEVQVGKLFAVPGSLKPKSVDG